MKINKLIAFPTALALMAVLGFGIVGNVANAQVGGPRVAIQLLTTGLTSPLVATSTNATVARLVLDTTGSTEAVRITSLPYILTTGAGAQAAHLNNCRVYNEADLNTALNTGVTLQSGLNNVALNAPLVLAANTVTTLTLRCDVSGDLVTGGTYTFSMNTANLVATGATTGLPALVLVRGAAVIPPTTPVVPVVPGLPTTGASGGSTGGNSAILFGSVLLAIMGLGVAGWAERKMERA
jgi:hypothetical protein